ncbi:MAG: response regulator [Deltaproteobacteria bacterium]|nr:response regulator [Deltaproteobacteria bacterium]
MAKIMVVEDDDGILEILKRFLVSLGYEAILADSGEEALKRMKEMPEIVILDIMMPGMNGFGVLEEIKEKVPSTEVMVMTGVDEIELGIECIERGAFEFMPKPLNLDHLKLLLEFKLKQMGVTN